MQGVRGRGHLRAREGAKHVQGGGGGASASTGGGEASARSAGSRICEHGRQRTSARSAGGRRSASTGGSEASARSAGEGASASTGGGEASARRAPAYPGSALATPRPRSRLRSRSSRSSTTSRTPARRTIRCNNIPRRSCRAPPQIHPFLVLDLSTATARKAFSRPRRLRCQSTTIKTPLVIGLHFRDPASGASLPSLPAPRASRSVAPPRADPSSYPTPRSPSVARWRRSSPRARPRASAPWSPPRATPRIPRGTTTTRARAPRRRRRARGRVPPRAPPRGGSRRARAPPGVRAAAARAPSRRPGVAVGRRGLGRVVGPPPRRNGRRRPLRRNPPPRGDEKKKEAEASPDASSGMTLGSPAPPTPPPSPRLPSPSSGNPLDPPRGRAARPTSAPPSAPPPAPPPSRAPARQPPCEDSSARWPTPIHRRVLRLSSDDSAASSGLRRRVSFVVGRRSDDDDDLFVESTSSLRFADLEGALVRVAVAADDPNATRRGVEKLLRRLEASRNVARTRRRRRGVRRGIREAREAARAEGGGERARRGRERNGPGDEDETSPGDEAASCGAVPGDGDRNVGRRRRERRRNGASSRPQRPRMPRRPRRPRRRRSRRRLDRRRERAALDARRRGGPLCRTRAGRGERRHRSSLGGRRGVCRRRRGRRARVAPRLRGAELGAGRGLRAAGYAPRRRRRARAARFRQKYRTPVLGMMTGGTIYTSLARELGSERGEKKRLSFASIITGATRATRGQTHGTIPNAEQSSRVRLVKETPIKKETKTETVALELPTMNVAPRSRWRCLARELQSHFPSARARHASPFRSLPPPTRPPPRGPWTRRTAGWIP